MWLLAGSGSNKLFKEQTTKATKYAGEQVNRKEEAIHSKLLMKENRLMNITTG